MLGAATETIQMLSPQRAFVIHLDSAADLSAQQPVGRIEHVVSGDSAHFGSLNDLFAFLARYSEPDSPPPGRSEGQ